MLARIYRPAKNAMQSGRANSRLWVLEFESDAVRDLDPLMGWTSINDTGEQVRLRFDSREDAIHYAQRAGLAFSVENTQTAKPMVKSYGANFAFDRKQPWTH